MLTVAVITILFSACRSGKKKETAKQPEVTAPEVSREITNTILTVPEDMVMVIHKVADFTKWKVAYEGNDSARLKSGLHSYFIGRGLYDSSMVLVALKADDMIKARAFAAGPGLKKAMQSAGVQGVPVFHYTIAVWQDTSKMRYPLSLTTFEVKDWDKWRASFDEGIQERDTNGVIVRVVGHEYDTNRNVVLVTALNDTAKAFRYFHSDLLRKRIEAGGVKSRLDRFLFRVVQQY